MTMRYDEYPIAQPGPTAKDSFLDWIRDGHRTKRLGSFLKKLGRRIVWSSMDKCACRWMDGYGMIWIWIDPYIYMYIFIVVGHHGWMDGWIWMDVYTLLWGIPRSFTVHHWMADYAKWILSDLDPFVTRFLQGRRDGFLRSGHHRQSPGWIWEGWVPCIGEKKTHGERLAKSWYKENF